MSFCVLVYVRVSEFSLSFFVFNPQPFFSASGSQKFFFISCCSTKFSFYINSVFNTWGKMRKKRKKKERERESEWVKWREKNTVKHFIHNEDSESRSRRMSETEWMLKTEKRLRDRNFSFMIIWVMGWAVEMKLFYFILFYFLLK
jgi:hypothetical protein